MLWKKVTENRKDTALQLSALVKKWSWHQRPLPKYFNTMKRIVLDHLEKDLTTEVTNSSQDSIRSTRDTATKTYSMCLWWLFIRGTGHWGALWDAGPSTALQIGCSTLQPGHRNIHQHYKPLRQHLCHKALLTAEISQLTNPRLPKWHKFSSGISPGMGRACGYGCYSQRAAPLEHQPQTGRSCCRQNTCRRNQPSLLRM